MKIKGIMFAVLALVASVSSVPVASAFELDCETSNCGIDNAVFQRALNHYCSNGRTYITKDGALTAARAAAAGQLDVEAFFGAFDSVCSFETAERVSRESRLGQLDYNAFSSGLFHYCSNSRTYVTTTGAISLGELVAARAVDLRSFLRVFDTTCSFEIAQQNATESQRGQLVLDVFFRAVFNYCSNGRTYITTAGATELAQIAARKPVRLEVFFDTWRSTCDFEVAKQVSCGD